jgi:hypothetical protein
MRTSNISLKSIEVVCIAHPEVSSRLHGTRNIWMARGMSAAGKCRSRWSASRLRLFVALFHRPCTEYTTKQIGRKADCRSPFVRWPTFSLDQARSTLDYCQPLGCMTSPNHTFATNESRMRSASQEIERNLRTGDHDDLFTAWPGHDLISRAERAHAELRQALVSAVKSRPANVRLSASISARTR